MKKITLPPFILMVIMLFVISCDDEIGPRYTGSLPPLSAMCLSQGDLAGWTVWDNACTVLGEQDLYEQIGTIAQNYYQNVDLLYIYQEISYGSETASIFVMDFRSESNAQAMYEYWRNDIAPYDTVDGYSRNYACYEDYGSGIYTFYAWYDRFYFEISLSGQPDAALAEDHIALMLDWYVGVIDDSKT